MFQGVFRATRSRGDLSAECSRDEDLSGLGVNNLPALGAEPVVHSAVDSAAAVLLPALQEFRQTAGVTVWTSTNLWPALPPRYITSSAECQTLQQSREVVQTEGSSQASSLGLGSATC